MTVKEIMSIYSGEYDDIEFYEMVNQSHRIHTDSIRAIECQDENKEVRHYELMDEDDYNHSVLANSSIYADFEAWYGNKDAKILIVVTWQNNENMGKYSWRQENEDIRFIRGNQQ